MNKRNPGRPFDPYKTYLCYDVACVLRGDDAHSKRFLSKSKTLQFDNLTSCGKERKERGFDAAGKIIDMKGSAVAGQAYEAMRLNKEGHRKEFLDYLNERERTWLFYEISIDPQRDKSVRYDVWDFVDGTRVRTILTNAQFDAYVAAAQKLIRKRNGALDYRQWRGHYQERLKEIDDRRLERLDYSQYLTRFDPQRLRPNQEAEQDYTEFLKRFDKQIERLKRTPMAHRDATSAEADAMDKARAHNHLDLGGTLPKVILLMDISRIVPLVPPPATVEHESNAGGISPYIRKHYPDHTGLPGCCCALCTTA